ncbi:hypothetical protein [Synechococcus sp. 8F6]|uniref:hypothetical protein n=1 Tax=Synechococcus sp. 8F6 TaxID=2025606 RepID=UPI00117C3DB7|nr:hypothetical protein [Synechococcus sp. 8F6]
MTPPITQKRLINIVFKYASHAALQFSFFTTFQYSYAQQTNNSSSLTNSAAPSASSVTTGGTNINYQTNNAYQNETGFGPGVYCRTPTLFIGGNYGENQLNAFDAVTNSGNDANNFSINAGLVVPFGSSVLESCKRIAAITVEDREISTQLSMIRACAQLQRDGIRVDPEQYPLLEKCSVSVIGPARSSQGQRSLQSPKSNQSTPQVPIKVPQTTRS